jgi:MFS transporter, OFA family, oxalate/formate antiporter
MATKSGVAQPARGATGWVVTLCATGALLALGVLYAWSVVKKEIPEAWGWSSAHETLPYAVAIVVFSVMTAVGGRLQERFGPRAVMTAGGLFAGAGMMLSSFTTSPWVFTFTFGVLLGTGIGFVYGSGTPAAVKWFPAHRTGMIAGIVVAGFGMGAAWVAPLSQALIDAYGVQTTLMLLGIGMLAVIVVLAQFVKPPPVGYIPAGAVPTNPSAPARSKLELAPKQVLRTWQFYVLWIAFAFGAGAGLMIIGNLASIVDTQAGLAAVAAVAVTSLAIGNGLGRVISGMLSDRFGRRIVLAGAFVFQGVLFVLLANIDGGSALATAPVILLLAALIGANYGANLAVFPAITRDYFGIKSFGSNYGLVYTAFGLGGFMISLGAGVINDATGTFTYAYYMAAALLVVAVVLMAVVRPPRAEEVRTAERPVSGFAPARAR